MKRRDEVLVGILITIALAVAVTGTLWLARRGLGADYYPLHTRMEWGAGLKQGQPVLLAGIQVGFVDQVELRQEGYLDVTLEIEEKYKVPDGSQAGMTDVSLFGDKAVRLTPPRRFSRGFVEPGDTIPAEPAAATINALIARADTVSRSLSDVAQAFEIQMVNQGGLLDLRRTIASTNQLIQQLNDIAAEQSRHLNATMMSLRRTASAVDSASVDSTVRNLETTSRNMARLTEQLEQTTTRMNGILARVESGDGTAARLLNDPGLYEDMRRLVTRLDSVTADFKKNPRRYINLEIF
jgi:phospholipid/cholesterol/gamma-HCH transport system substrate-binding protein